MRQKYHTHTHTHASLPGAQSSASLTSQSSVTPGSAAALHLHPQPCCSTRRRRCIQQPGAPAGTLSQERSSDSEPGSCSVEAAFRSRGPAGEAAAGWRPACPQAAAAAALLLSPTCFSLPVRGPECSTLFLPGDGPDGRVCLPEPEAATCSRL